MWAMDRGGIVNRMNILASMYGIAFGDGSEGHLFSKGIFGQRTHPCETPEHTDQDELKCKLIGFFVSMFSLY